METPRTSIPVPSAPAPVLPPTPKSSSKGWVAAVVIGLAVIALLLGGWWYMSRPAPTSASFRLEEGTLVKWYSLTDRTVTALAPEEAALMPSYELAGAASVARAEDGSLVALAPEGVVAVAADGTRTVLIEGFFERGHSAIAVDASMAALLNAETNALDVFSLDNVRPGVLSYEGSIALPEPPVVMSAVGFISREIMVVKTGKDTFELYRIGGGSISHMATAKLAGAKTSWNLIPKAHAYSYGVLSGSGAESDSGMRCTGTQVASLAGSGGSVEEGVPSGSVMMWDGITSTASLPSNYNNPGSYCIMGYMTSNNNTWSTSYTVHSGTGKTSTGASGTGGSKNNPSTFIYYTLTYSAAPMATLTASPTTIDSGSSVALSWTSANAASCTGTNFSTGGATSGTVSVSPTATTTYSVTCGAASASRTVNVLQRANLTASALTGPTSVPGGSSATYSATESNSGVVGAGAHKLFFVVGQNGIYVTSRELDITSVAAGATTGANSVSIPFGAPGTYTVRACADYYGAVNESNESDNCGAITTVTVTAAAPVTVSVSANPASAAAGAPVTITWSSTGAASCTATNGGFSTAGETSGSATVYPTQTTNYEVTCYSNSYSLGGVAIANGEWWTGGTQTVTYGDTVPNTGQQGSVCASQSSGRWNARIVTRYTADGDGFNDTATVTCWDVVNPTGTTEMPHEVQYSPGGGCPGGICIAETGYLRSSDGSVVSGGIGSAQAVVTVTTPQCNDGDDNDNDGLVDTLDGGCDDATDPDETGGSTLSCVVNPAVVALGGSATYTASASSGTPGSYTWTPTGGQSCVAGTGSSKSCTFATAGNYAMSVSASGYGTAQCPAVAAGVCDASSVQITATPDRVSGEGAGGSSTVTWSASAGCSCSVSGPGLSSSATSGSQAVSGITAQSTYTLSCSGNTDTATINIIPRFEEF